MAPSSPNSPAQPRPLPAPWYAGGLRFGCVRCGACCGGAPGYIWLDKRDPAVLARYLGLSEGRFLQEYTRRVGTRLSLREHPDYDCVLFDPQARSCRAWPVRPAQCRTWPWWPENLATPEAWDRCCRQCPGAGRGPRHPVRVIERALAAAPPPLVDLSS